MKKAVLLPIMVEFPSLSMTRYGMEATRALCAANRPDWEFEALEVHHVEAAMRLLPGEQGKQMASRLGRFVRYPALAKRTPGDVYHIFDHSHANLTLALPGPKTVITCHDIIPYLAALGVLSMPTGRLTRYSFPQRIRCMKRCRFIVADSEQTRQDLIQYGNVDPERVVVIYCGMDPVFRPQPADGRDAAAVTRELRQKWGVPPEGRVVLHVGTKNRYKNTPALFHALRLLRAEPSLKDNVWLVRAGGPFFEDEETLIDEIGVRERVIHIGRVPDDQGLADCYRAADALAFPSLYEGFGWPPLEAMACGTPVVTSNAASLPEIVGDAGITVDPHDHEALAGGLLRVLENPDLAREMRDKGRERASGFTWQRFAQDAITLYDRVIAGD